MWVNRRVRKTGKNLNLHFGSNNPALKLYERLGFKTIDINGVNYFMERMPKLLKISPH